MSCHLVTREVVVMLTLTHVKVKYNRKLAMLSASEDYSRQQVKSSVHEIIRICIAQVQNCSPFSFVHLFINKLLKKKYNFFKFTILQLYRWNVKLGVSRVCAKMCTYNLQWK